MEKDICKIKPWLRFWVRSFDLIVFFLVSRFVLWNSLLFLEKTPLIRLVIIAIVIILIEAVFICFLGQTPAKWFCNMKVKSNNGGNPSFSQALRRTFLVWIKGMFLNIPVFCLVAMWCSKKSLTKNGISYWDEVCNTIVEHKRVSLWRYALIGSVVVLFNLIIYVSVIDFIYSNRFFSF